MVDMQMPLERIIDGLNELRTAAPNPEVCGAAVTILLELRKMDVTDADGLRDIVWDREQAENVYRKLYAKYENVKAVKFAPDGGYACPGCKAKLRTVEKHCPYCGQRITLRLQRWKL